MRQLSLVPPQSSPACESDREANFRIARAISDAWHATPEGVALESAAQAAGIAWTAAIVAVADSLKPVNRRLTAARRFAKVLTGAEREAALVVVDELIGERAVTRARVSVPLITARRKAAETTAAMNASMAALWRERARGFR